MIAKGVSAATMELALGGLQEGSVSAETMADDAAQVLRALGIPAPRLRARQRQPGITPASWCQARNGEGPGCTPGPPATEQGQTKLYGFVVNSWSDKVLSVQRIRTRTRTR